MKISAIKYEGPGHYQGWLKHKFGEHYMQLSTDYTLKLRLATHDVSRMRRGFVPQDILELAHKFEVAPQGVTDLKFVMGYENDDEGWIDGSIESDVNLQEYIKRYPDDWNIVKEAMGLTRLKSKHPCHPAGTLILTVDEGNLKQLEIEKCHDKIVMTGQGAIARAILLDQGIQEVMEYTMENGEKILCTPSHRLLTTVGWKMAHEVMSQNLDLLVQTKGIL